MKQKLLSFLTLLTFAIGQLYAYDFSAANSDGVVIYYNIIDNGVEVTSNQSTYRDNVVIPGTVSFGNTDYAVTVIGDMAFAYCSGLTSVSIPNSVTAIGDIAFADCSGLTSVSIPNSVTAIGNEAFSWCSGLTSVSIPNSVTAIGDRAFYLCSGLTSVSIPNSVTTIGNAAFAYCSGLTSVSIPNSITAIGIQAFTKCSNLAAFYGKYSSDDNRCLIIDGNLIAFAPAGVRDYTIPNSVTAIGDYAFADCSGLISVSIPNSITAIGDKAFAYCNGLTSVSISNSVTAIGDRAFYDCSGLTSVLIPNSVTTIGNEAFANCYGLTSVSIPNSVTTIGNEAFDDCYGLTSVSIPNSVTAIGVGAFNGCSGLAAFYGKYSSDDNRCLIIDGNLIAFAPAGIRDYTIPNSVTAIGDRAFYRCSGLTSISIPNSVTSIGNSAFYRCSSLTAFYGKYSSDDNRCLIIDGDLIAFAPADVTDYTIPNSATAIGDYAFAYCSGLQYIKVEWPSPEDIVLGSNIFNWVDTRNCALVVPDGTIDLYAVTEPWSGFVIKEGEPAISEMLPEDVYARIEGIYTCNGDGATFNLGISIYPEDDEKYLKKVIIYGWKGYEWAQIECDFSFNASTGVPNLSIPVGTPVALDVDFGDIGVCNVYVLECSSDVLSLSGTINVAGNEDVSVFTFQNGIAGGIFNGSATYSSYMGYAWFSYQTLTMSKQLGIIDEVDAPDTDDITITTNSGELQIHNTLSGEPVALYTLMGQMLYSGVTTDAVTTVPVNLSKGTICILRVGAHTRKVVF